MNIKIEKSDPDYQNLLKQIEKKLSEDLEEYDRSVPRYEKRLDPFSTILEAAGTNKSTEEILASIEFPLEDV